LQDSTTAVVSKEQDDEKRVGIVNNGFVQSKQIVFDQSKQSTFDQSKQIGFVESKPTPSLTSLETSTTLPSQARFSRLFSGKIPDFLSASPVRQQTSQTQDLPQSPVMTIKFSSEPRSITGGTRVWIIFIPNDVFFWKVNLVSWQSNSVQSQEASKAEQERERKSFSG